MDIAAAFADAQQRVKGLTKRPSNEELLKLYSLFKQANDGDASGKRPGMFDLKGRAKYDAWAKLKGTGKDDAAQNYVDLVDNMLEKYS